MSTPEIRAAMLAMKDSGKTQVEVAEAYGISLPTAASRLFTARKEAGRPGHPGSTGKQKPGSGRKVPKGPSPLDANRAAMLAMQDKGASVAAIAEAFNVSTHAVRARLRKARQFSGRGKQMRGDERYSAENRTDKHNQVLDLLDKGYTPSTIRRKVLLSYENILELATLHPQLRAAERKAKEPPPTLAPARKPMSGGIPRCSRPGCRTLFERTSPGQMECPRHRIEPLVARYREAWPVAEIVGRGSK